MFKKTILVFTISACNIFANNPSIHPIVKSAILPGWGEAEKKYTQRSRFFLMTEVVLWSSCISAYTFSAHKEKQFKAFAVKHAGIDARGKNREYWVDIGNYQNMMSHNEEHLRFREIEALYLDRQGWDWSWDSRQNRDEYENMRISSDQFALVGKFIVGGIVLNHIISAIDSLYLTRLEKIDSITLTPTIGYNKDPNLSLRLEFNF